MVSEKMLELWKKYWEHMNNAKLVYDEIVRLYWEEQEVK